MRTAAPQTASPRATPADRVAWRVTLTATAAWVVLYGWLNVRHHAGYGTQTFDFGIYDQGLWLLSRLEEPFVTVRGLHLFGDHSSYLMVPLAPLYWVWADPRALLVLTVVALAVGAPLVHALARSLGLPSVLAAALAAGYLLYPSLSWQAWWNFHSELYAIPLVILGFLLLVRGRLWWAVAAFALVLLAKEDAALLIGPVAIYVGWRHGAWRQGLTLLALSVGAFVLSFAVLLPHFSPTGELLYTGRYAAYGDGMLDAAVGMVSNPLRVLGELADHGRVVYLVQMLLPLPLALVAPRLLVLAAPITLANLLSLHGYQHEIRWHYAAYLLAIVTVAAVAGARALHRALGPRSAGPLAAGVLAAALIANVLTSPSPIGRHHGVWSRPGPDTHLIDEAIALIPAGATVSAPPFLAPHLTHRRTIYMFPNPFVRDNWAAPGVPLPTTRSVDWVVAFSNPSPGSRYAAALDRIDRSGEFELVMENDRAVVYRRAGSEFANRQ